MRMRHLHSLKSLMLVFFLFLFSGPLSDAHVLSLNGTWEYVMGYDPSFLSLENSLSWKRIAVPGNINDRKEFAHYDGLLTFRRKITIEEKGKLLALFSLSFRSGIVLGAAEFYLNQHLIGRVGDFSKPLSGREGELVVDIPGSYFNTRDDDFFYVKIKINRIKGSNGFQGPEILIGSSSDIYGKYYNDIAFSIVLLSVYFLVSTLYLFLGLKRLKDIYYLLYGLYVLLFTLWCSANFPVWEFIYGDNYALKRSIDIITIKLVAAVYLLFISFFFYRKITPVYGIICGISLLFAFLDLFLPLNITSGIFNIFMIILCMGLFYLLFDLFRLFLKKKEYALLFFLCLFIITLFSIRDVLISFGLIRGSYSIYYAFPVFILSGAYILVDYTIRNNTQLEKLTHNLEELVKERTAELSKANSQLKELSFMDPLTNLRNRRYVWETISEEIDHFLTQDFDREEEKRENLIESKSFGVFMIDIDHFKIVNDTYGHAAGDEVLKAISGTLSEIIRFDDYLVRWGGEEFLLLLRNTDRNHLAQFAKKMKETINRLEIKISDRSLVQVTISIGGIALPYKCQGRESLNLQESIHLCDLALYIAKRTGRNRAILLEAPIEKVLSYEEISHSLSRIESSEDMGKTRQKLLVVE
ncbi:MAG: GGDEF domain-containing protein [Spirochaetales bacterium]|nr:GGDEF domain-containing protein [Spirochaetales bacterium]